MTLMDLTHQESDIIVCGEESVAVVNWASLDDDYMPMLGPFGSVIGWPDAENVFVGAQKERVTDIRDVLPGTVWRDDDGEAHTDMDIVSDPNGDLSALFLGREGGYTPDKDGPVSGTVYTLRDGRRIITPTGWN